MRVGITGTRAGAYLRQRTTLTALLRTLTIDVLHHGDCVGVDVFAAGIVNHFAATESHPPSSGKHRAHFGSDVVHKPKEYLARNQDIVDAVDLLIVVPKTRQEGVRSGTWATYRYAVLTKVPRVIIYPDGDMIYEAA